jgi:acyl-coenzyme A synthetase/AMP-(fatty) acid ligase
MFSAPTAVRVLKKQDPAFLKKYDLSSLRRCSWPASRWTNPRRAGSARA